MAEYERTESVAAPPDALFTYLSDPANLPAYVRRLRAADPRGGGDGGVDRLRVGAELPDGGTVQADAWLVVERAERLLTWGAEELGLGGELQVTGEGSTSSLRVRLRTDHLEGPQVETDLLDTVRNVRRLVEGHPPAP